MNHPEEFDQTTLLIYSVKDDLPNDMPGLETIDTSETILYFCKGVVKETRLISTVSKPIELIIWLMKIRSKNVQRKKKLPKLFYAEKKKNKLSWECHTRRY